MPRRAASVLELLVVTAILALLIGLLLSAVQRVRQAALAAAGRNNLRQIGLALHSVASTNDGVLPGCVFEGDRFRWGTLVELLPYLEREDLYRLYRDSFFWPTRGTRVKTYLDPSDYTPAIDADIALASYALNAQIFFTQSSIASVTDGLSSTAWLATHYSSDCAGTAFRYDVAISHPPEGSTDLGPVQIPTFAQSGAAVLGYPWPINRGDLYPITTGNPPTSSASGGLTFQVRPTTTECNPRMPNSPLPGGMSVGMADGSVRFLAASVSPAVFWGMVSPNGGETIED